MTPRERLQVRHAFVELLPDALEERTLYVSVEYKSVVHLCLCGCGKKVITPLSPTGWRMTFDGKTISLYPSIGNWNLSCRSHYWISRSEVEWADRWSQDRIDAGFAHDARLKEAYYEGGRQSEARRSDPSRIEGAPASPPARPDNWWTRVKQRLSRRRA